jgi:hypothetical protein
VLLLDEIEKAHPDIFNVLLQVMDHGTLTDNNGRKADFRNVIIIMTTNAGAETMNKATIGFTNPRQAGDEMGDIKRLFTPEFRNRLDAIVSFKALDEQIILRVVDKFLLQLETQLAEKKVEVTFTDALRKHLAKKGFDPLMGARPMQRLIQDTIRRALADELLFGRLTDGGRLTVDIHTFLWHDYETFGADTRRDRPAQFAAIRTDAELNEIGEPLMPTASPPTTTCPTPTRASSPASPRSCAWKRACPSRLCEPHRGRWPSPAPSAWATTPSASTTRSRASCSGATSSTPTRASGKTVRPVGLAGRGAHDLGAAPRGHHLAARKTAAPSFKLEHLTAANGLAHESAHDALSDVRATMALARLIRQHNSPSCSTLPGAAQKDRVAAELRLPCHGAHGAAFSACLGHVPGVERGCLAVMWPLASHPTNKNELIAWDLARPRRAGHLPWPRCASACSPAGRPARGRGAPAHQDRAPEQIAHGHRQPQGADARAAQRWGLDLDQALRHAATARDLPDMSAIWPEVFRRPEPDAPVDPEHDLYGGFVGNADRRRLTQLRALDPGAGPRAHRLRRPAPGRAAAALARPQPPRHPERRPHPGAAAGAPGHPGRRRHGARRRARRSHPERLGGLGGASGGGFGVRGGQGGFGKAQEGYFQGKKWPFPAPNGHVMLLKR